MWLGSSSVNRSAGPEQEVKCKQDVLVFTVILCVCVLKLGVVKKSRLLVFELDRRRLSFWFEKKLRQLVLHCPCLYTGTHLSSRDQAILPGA